MPGANAQARRGRKAAPRPAFPRTTVTGRGAHPRSRGLSADRELERDRRRHRRRRILDHFLDAALLAAQARELLLLQLLALERLALQFLAAHLLELGLGRAGVVAEVHRHLLGRLATLAL